MNVCSKSFKFCLQYHIALQHQFTFFVKRQPSFLYTSARTIFMAKKKKLCTEEASSSVPSSSSIDNSLLPPSHVYLQVIEPGSLGSGKCVFVSTDNHFYLFNATENAARIMRIMPNYRFSKLQNLFVTHRSWPNLNGIHGICLNLSNAGVKSLNLHGPSGVDSIFTATNWMYDGAAPVQLNLHHFSAEKFEDDSMHITYVPLLGKSKESNGGDKLEDKIDVSTAYICCLKRRPGKMNVEKAVKLGIPFGPLFGQLQRGKSVKLNNRLINPEEVLLPADPSTSFIVLDICDELMLESLLKARQFDEYFYVNRILANADEPMSLIVHLTDDKIFHNPRYQDWMKKFGPTTRHLVVNDSVLPLPINEGIFKLQAQLNRLNPRAFPLLNCHKTPYLHDNADLNAKIVKAEPFLIYHLRPHDKFQREKAMFVRQSANEYGEEMLKDVPELKPMIAEYENQCEANRSIIASTVESESSTSSGIIRPDLEYPEIVFFGTASAVQTKYRSVSCTLVNLNAYHSMLLDCGESAFSQMVEYFGPREVWSALTRIKAIFISHMHADHHMGLFTILMKRREAFERLDLNFEPVHLLAPGELFKTHFLYSGIVEDVMPLAKRFSTTSDARLIAWKLAEIKSRLNFKSMITCKVTHPRSAYGLIFEMASGYKVVYSGDTMPCARLVSLGADCDLLIHEATLDDTRMADAKLKCHCTVGQAIEVAHNMNAKYAILTHISSRSLVPLMSSDLRAAIEEQRQIFDETAVQSKINSAEFFTLGSIPLASMDSEAQRKYKTFCFAFDFMRYTPQLGSELSSVRPLICKALQRHFDEGVTRAQNYDLRLIKQRERNLNQMNRNIDRKQFARFQK